jgi:two-component system, chemotaxis family, sensor kinase CheA
MSFQTKKEDQVSERRNKNELLRLGCRETHVKEVPMVNLVSDLQENILNVRMLKIAAILNGFPSLVRDMAQKADKKVDFVVEGQETELDRYIAEQIRDPLLFLVKNAIDDGIELPQKRLQAGKPEKGIIRLCAYHEQSYIVVSISDDGRGIDVQEVKRATARRGFLSAEAVARMSNNEAQNLIFLNEVSTLERTAGVSGKVVSLDIVKTNISNIGGSLSVESKLGHGTIIKMRLPQTIATIDGVLVSSGGLTYIIPISSIVDILCLKPNQIQRVRGKEVYTLRENIIPLTRLSRRFEPDSDRAKTLDETNVVVIKVGDKLLGVMVDSVLEESVVKPIGKYNCSSSDISGATIIRDGKIALILDAAGLINEYY